MSSYSTLKLLTHRLCRVTKQSCFCMTLSQVKKKPSFWISNMIVVNQWLKLICLFIRYGSRSHVKDDANGYNKSCDYLFSVYIMRMWLLWYSRNHEAVTFVLCAVFVNKYKTSFDCFCMWFLVSTIHPIDWKNIRFHIEDVDSSICDMFITLHPSLLIHYGNNSSVLFLTSLNHGF